MYCSYVVHVASFSSELLFPYNAVSFQRLIGQYCMSQQISGVF